MAELVYKGVANTGGFPALQAGTLAERPPAPAGKPVYLVIEPTGLYLTRYDGTQWVSIGASESAVSILSKLLTVDGAGSGLDADLLDGVDSQTFYDFTNEARNLIMSGGGDISWGVVANKLKWTQRFIFMPISENASTNKFVELVMPTSGVTDGAGAERASVDGITLNTWDSLWFVHTRGGAFNAGISWKVLTYTDAAVSGYFDDENAYLIAVRNSDVGNSSAYLRNGLVIPSGKTVKAGKAIPDIVDADVSASAAIAESKLALASDAAAGTASRRTLGTGALQALPGNHSSTTDTRAPTDGTVTVPKHVANQGPWIRVADAAGRTSLGAIREGQLVYQADNDTYYQSNSPDGTDAATVSWTGIAAGGVPDSSTTVKGVTKLSVAPVTSTDPIAVGTNDPRMTPTGSTRVAAYPINNVNLALNGTVTSGDLRGTGTPAIPSDAKGVKVMLLANGSGFLAADSAGLTPNGFSPRMNGIGAPNVTSMIEVDFGTGANAGKITLIALVAAMNNVYMWPTGWYR